jgi:hypothetical protein
LSETLLGPRVDDAGLQRFQVLLVHVDGFSSNGNASSSRASSYSLRSSGCRSCGRSDSASARLKLKVGLRHVERRGRRHVGDLVRHEPVHRLDRRVHALLLVLQAGLERLQQPHGRELPVELLREDQRRACGERPGASRPFGSGVRIDAHDLPSSFSVERLVVRRLVNLGDLERVSRAVSTGRGNSST